jgi:hypothetical protein
MSKDYWMFDEIEVTVSGCFTTHHHLSGQSGAYGEITFPAFATGAEFESASGRNLSMQKTRWWGSQHELADSRGVLGRADRAGILNRDINVWFDGQEYVLQPEGLFKQGWFLVDSQGAQLLEIQPRGVFRQGAYLSIKGVVDSALVVFAYYLIHMRQQEDAAAVAATSAS